MARYGKEHKQATRRRIIEAAGQRLKRDGIDGSGVSVLMADAGLTNGAFYAHFASKEELVATAVADQLRQQLPFHRDALANKAAGVIAVHGGWAASHATPSVWSRRGAAGAENPIWPGRRRGQRGRLRPQGGLMSRRFWACLAAGVSLGLLLPAVPAAAARDRTPPTTPANLHITATTATTISLAWDASTDNSSNFWYCVQTNGGGCIRVNPPQTTLTRTRLLPERTHTFAVYALDIAGNRSANSNTVSYTTPPDTRPPSPPPTLSTTSVAPTTISLAWTPSVDDISQVWTSLFVDGSAVFVDDLRPPNFTLPNLTPETTYEFKVTVRDASGNVAESNVLAVTTPPVTDMQPPTAPTELRRLSTGDPLDVLLRWTQSTDETDPQAAIRYQIFFDGVLNGSVIGTARAWTTCVELGPTEVFLRSVDTSGNVSAPSNSITIDCTDL